MTTENGKPNVERRTGKSTRSGEDRRKADRRVADVPVEEERRKGPIRTEAERRRGDRRKQPASAPQSTAAEGGKPPVERRSGKSRRSGEERRKAERRVADVAVENDRRKSERRSGQDRRKAERRSR